MTNRCHQLLALTHLQNDSTASALQSSVLAAVAAAALAQSLCKQSWTGKAEQVRMCMPAGTVQPHVSELGNLADADAYLANTCCSAGSLGERGGPPGEQAVRLLSELPQVQM